MLLWNWDSMGFSSSNTRLSIKHIIITQRERGQGTTIDDLGVILAVHWEGKWEIQREETAKKGF